uniref:F5/8 type C domain-containing protein n=1 Tax=Mesocestoides corti TaxID=53468 RepID=A0A5K3F1L4_MESCO
MLPVTTLIWIVSEFLVSACSAQHQQTCKSTLLANLPETAFVASAEVTPRYSASAARMSSDDDIAWCVEGVQPHDEKEFLEIDLGQLSFVKLIITKGLSTADKGGLYMTSYYYIWYRRDTSQSTWIKYQNINGTTRIKGNLDAQTERYVSMNPPFVARWVRIYPFTLERKPACLKLELIGCSANGVIEYQAPRGHLLSKSPRHRLLDVTYDSPEHRHDFSLGAGGVAFHRQAFNVGGLGKLVDGKPDSEVDSDPLETNLFVGWKRETRRDGELDFERVVFRFDAFYNFSGVSLLLADQLGSEVARPKRVEVRLSRRFPRGTSTTNPSTTNLVATHELPSSDVAALRRVQWMRVDLTQVSRHAADGNSTHTDAIYDTVANYVELRIHYGGPWIAIAEVTFDNSRVEVPPELYLLKESVEPIPLVVSGGSGTSSQSGGGNASVEALIPPPYNLAPMQPHTYALVVGLGCLATILIILVLVLFVHWRRRAFLASHKLDEINRTFQHPSTMQLMKAATSPQPAHSTKMCVGAQQLPMYLNGEGGAAGGGGAYVAGFSPSAIMSQYLLQQQHQQQQTGNIPNSLVLPNYHRSHHHLPAHPTNAQTPPEHSSHGEGDNQPALFPYYQAPNQTVIGATSESTAVYTTVSDSDPYVNATPRQHQMMRIPPPPSLPLPPPPPPPPPSSNQSGTPVEHPQLSPWMGTLGREAYMQHSGSSGSCGLNTFYRYSVPVNGGAFPATPVYSAPVWTATSSTGTMDAGGSEQFFQQQQSPRQLHLLPQDASDLPEYSSATPVSSIIYGGFYGQTMAFKEPRRGPTEVRLISPLCQLHWLRHTQGHVEFPGLASCSE